MKHSSLPKDLQKIWRLAFTASINGNPAWKKDFERWSKKYNNLMKEKLKILRKFPEIFEKYS